jgi:hypothetical protein
MVWRVFMIVVFSETGGTCYNVIDVCEYLMVLRIMFHASENNGNNVQIDVTTYFILTNH